MDTEKERILIDKPAVSELFGNPKKFIIDRLLTYWESVAVSLIQATRTVEFEDGL